MERVAFGLFVVLVVGGSTWEFARWRSADYRNGLTSSQQGRRIVGALLLLCVSTMGYAQTYFPVPPEMLPPLVQSFEMVYFGILLILGLAIPLVGYLEIKETMQRLGDEKRRISRELLDLERAQKGPGAHE